MATKNPTVSLMLPEQIPACGVTLANTPGDEAGYIWSKRYGWQARINPHVAPDSPCGTSDGNHRRCERCMRAAGAIW